jgi:putative transposase
MRHDQYTIAPRDIHRHAARLCQRYLRFQDHGPVCTALNLLTVLFYAAARVISRAAACAALRDAPSDSALHAALMATLPDIAALQRRLNRALQGDLPKALRRRPPPLAIDLILIPYHGEPATDANEVYRGQAKDGTTHCHAYATAYVLPKGQRFTVALAYVKKGDDLADVVKGLLRQAAQAGVRPRYPLLDRGFYAVSVLRYLQAARCPFLMPVPCKGRKADHPKGPSGTRVFHLRKRGGWSGHTLKSGDGRTATIQVCVKCRNLRGERQKHGRQGLCTRMPVSRGERDPPAFESDCIGTKPAFLCKAGARRCVRLLGASAVERAVGVPDVSAAVRDRDDLPAAAPGANPDQHPGPAAAAVVCRAGVNPPERVGLAPWGGAIAPAPRRPKD